MKNKLMLVVATGSLLIAQSSQAASWGVKELLISSQVVTDYFKTEMGAGAYNAITGVSVELNAQKIASKAKITYIKDGKPTVASYFCHEHEADAIDCH